jgi:homoserine O-acetyltransferase/O-succinyltransferase
MRTFTLESGVVLRDVRQAYTLHGELSAGRDNVVVLFHSLTGTPDPTEWWPSLIGAGRVLDTDRFAVLSANLLGSCYGTTCRWPTPRPVVTTRDMARLQHALLMELGVRRVVLAAGGSLGGMVALEWAATFPDLTAAVVAFAAPAAHTAHAIGLNHVQRRAIEVGGAAGLELARQIALLTYRTPDELERRFGRDRRGDGVFQVESYLTHHGAKLRRRFTAASYLSLLDSMDGHDVGRGRGGSAAALQAFRGTLAGVGIPGDLLYAPADVRAWCGPAHAAYREIVSPHGHDAFLLEPAQTAAIIGSALGAAGQGSAT